MLYINVYVSFYIMYICGVRLSLINNTVKQEENVNNREDLEIKFV